MKKRTMAVGGLLLAVAMTGYSVAGTYAKYVSSIDFTEEARVAQWQIQAQDVNGAVTENLNLFSDSYSVNDKGLYVKSLDGGKVIAPGTKGEYQINFAGNMEVRYMLDLKLEGENPWINYAVKAEDGSTKVGVYDPITYKVTLFKGAETYLTAEGSFDEVVEALDNYSDVTKTEFEPGKLGLSLKIEWSWNAENEIDGLTREQVDALDTQMGEELSVYTEYDEDGKGTTKFNYGEYKLTVSAIQVAEDHAERTN